MPTNDGTLDAELLQIPKPELGRPNDSRLTAEYIALRPELAGVTPFDPRSDVDLVDQMNDALAHLHTRVQQANVQAAQNASSPAWAISTTTDNPRNPTPEEAAALEVIHGSRLTPDGWRQPLTWQDGEWKATELPQLDVGLLADIAHNAELNNAATAQNLGRKTALSVATIGAEAGLYNIISGADAGQVWERLADGNKVRQPNLEAASQVSYLQIRDKTSDYVVPQAFGASGKGDFDDAPAIQAALAAIRGKNLTLHLPDDCRFVLATLTQGEFPGFLPLYAEGLRVRGAGVLTVPDGFTAVTGGNWNMFSSLENAVDVGNLDLDGQRFDLNGQQNHVPDGGRSGSRTNAAVLIRTGHKISLQNLSISNAPGAWGVALGKDVSPHSTHDVTLRNIKFYDCGRATGSPIFDHSTIYVQADGLLMEGCTAWNRNPAREATAYEVHATRSLVRGNTARGYLNVFNVVAIYNAMIGTRFTDNIGYDCHTLYHVWTMNGWRMAGVRLGGTLEQSADAELDGIMASLNVLSEIESLDIDDFNLVGAGVDNTAQLSNGVALGWIKDAVVRNTVLSGLHGRGITLDDKINPDAVGVPSNRPRGRLTLENNSITDSAHGAAGYRSGIALNSTFPLGYLRMAGNVLDSSGAEAHTVGTAPIGLLDWGSGNVSTGTTSQLVVLPNVQGRSENRGSVIIPEGLNFVNVPHGLGAIPSYVSAIAELPNGQAVSCPLRNDAVLGLHIPNAAAAGGVRLDWEARR